MLSLSLYVEPASQSTALSSSLPLFSPVAQTSLSSIVSALKSVTTNMTDTDGDSLPDSVETVIGTDFNNTDSDFDRLTDSYEIENDLDPLNPDSNNDGLPDYYEVTDVLSLDLDGDNITNGWDFDNDGDGVNDALDLSPFAKSTMSSSFHFDITTNGLPTYITFQLRPQNPEYLKLLNQFWNWKDCDKEGIMKDLDSSLDDVQIVPMLNLSANIVPEQSKVMDYGITIESNQAYVPLYAVSEYGNIVAFSGKMVYPLGPPLNLSANVELIWQVIGKSDQDTTAILAQNGRYLSILSDGTVVANSSEISSEETLQWVDLGANTVAFRAANGLYLSVADDGTIFANASEVDDREMFELSDNGGGKTALKACNGKYLTVSNDGTLVASSTGKIWSWLYKRYLSTSDFIMIDTDVVSESYVLATYKEPFMLTGLKVEENYGSSFGLFFSHDRNQTIAANILLAYDFLRNSTTQLSEMPAILAEYDSEVFSQIDWFGHKDEALKSLATEVMPNILNALSAGAGSQILPIITSVEDHFVTLDMAQLISGSYIMGVYCNATLTYEPIVTSKSLKMDLYNTTSYEALEIDDMMVEVEQWEQDEDAAYQLMSMMSAWNAGEQFITSVGSNKTEFDFFGEYLNIFNTVRKYGFGAFKVYKTAFRGYEAYRIVSSTLTKLTKQGWSIGGKTFRSMFKVWKANWKKIGAAKTGKFAAFKRIGYVLDMVGALIETGIAIYSLFQILDSGLTPMGLNTALLGLLMNLMYSMTLAMIGVIPVVGWLISLAIALSDLIGNWSTKLFNAILSAITKVTAQVDPSISLAGEPSLSIIDKDGNGLDVGDRIEYYARMIGKISSSDSWCLSSSEIYPYVKIANQTLANSNVEYFYLTRRGFMASELGKKGNDIWLWLPIPPTSTWKRTSGSGWQAQEYTVGGAIEPGIAMPNFPVTIQTYAEYDFAYKWKHFVFLVFYAFWCHHKDHNGGILQSQTTPMGSQTFYFDVLPGSLADFLKWKSIKRLDTDFDGIADTEENATISNPLLYDTDGDGLNDKYELDIGTNPRLFDTDQDGLNDKLELVYGTDPADVDTDADGLSDYAEITGWISVFNYGGSQFTLLVTSNPLVIDTDDDGLNDNLECSSRLNPKSQDTDGDGIIDQERTPPDLPAFLVDSDGDGLNDSAEEVGWNITFTNATGTYTLAVTSETLLKDTDFDGLTDYQEYDMSSNPRNPDTDGDGLDDYFEKESGTSLTSFDTDGDGLDDGTELTLNSSPTKSDTDGDGLLDLDEINLGTDLGNNDTDSDGLTDLQEFLFGSNATLPDTDDDLLFDSQEFILGTDPTLNDTDNDGLLDGWEIIYETNPLNNDTDNDLVLDGEEIKRNLNPTSNDTDVDELLDGVELELGTDPRNPDTDFDGLIDSEDPDSYVPNVKQVVLAFDRDSDPSEFIENLSLYTNVTVVSPEEFLANYTDVQYIVLVGRPNTDNGTVGNIIYDLLEDSGDVLSSMMESDLNRFAVRYGVWTSKQTVLTISQPYFADHFRVLEMLKSKNVTILPDSMIVDYQILAAPGCDVGNYSIYFITDEMDMVKTTDAVVAVGLEEQVKPSIQINRYNAMTTPQSLTGSSGLSSFEKTVGRYLEVEVSENVQNETDDNIIGALLQMYYSKEDLDRTGDGEVDDLEDFDENTLALYFLNETTGLWAKITEDLDWVRAVGVNTTDVEVYGTLYEGYVWAYVSRLPPLYAIAGRTFNQPPDVSKAYPSQECLWPPNHSFVNITIEGVTDPDGDPITIEILNITSDEPTASTHWSCCEHLEVDFDQYLCGCEPQSCCHAPDAHGIGTETAQLRAERFGNGNGRVYVITFVASDGRGGESVGNVAVYVPHDEHGGTCHCIDDGQYYDATETNWEMIEGET